MVAMNLFRNVCLFVAAVVFFYTIVTHERSSLNEGGGYHEQERMAQGTPNVPIIGNNFNLTVPRTIQMTAHHDERVCMYVRFASPGSLPFIALLSAPGSGSTWLRYLLERATGVYTGSMYKDDSLLNGGFLGEGESPRSGRVIVVKTHTTDILNGSVDGMVMLVRNPYSAIVSDFTRLTSGGNHTGRLSPRIFKSKNWAMYARWAANRWHTTIQRGMQTVTEKRLVVFYEDLLEDLATQLRELTSFLNVSVSERRIQCTIIQKEGNFHRKRHLATFDPLQQT